MYWAALLITFLINITVLIDVEGVIYVNSLLIRNTF